MLLFGGELGLTGDAVGSAPNLDAPGPDFQTGTQQHQQVRGPGLYEDDLALFRRDLDQSRTVDQNSLRGDLDRRLRLECPGCTRNDRNRFSVAANSCKRNSAQSPGGRPSSTLKPSSAIRSVTFPKASANEVRPSKVCSFAYAKALPIARICESSTT